MNDLSYTVKHASLFTYADDTQIFCANKDLNKIAEAILNNYWQVLIDGMKRME